MRSLAQDAPPPRSKVVLTFAMTGACGTAEGEPKSGAHSEQTSIEMVSVGKSLETQQGGSNTGAAGVVLTGQQGWAGFAFTGGAPQNPAGHSSSIAMINAAIPMRRSTFTVPALFSD